MRNIILILVIFSVFSCKKAESNTGLKASQDSEINAIVKAVITQDSLDILGSGTSRKSLCRELIRLHIYIPEKSKYGEMLPPLPPSFTSASINELLHFDRKQIFFKAADSIHLLQQNSNPEKLAIDTRLFDNVNFTTKDKEIAKKKITKSYNFYEMTIPVFSVNGQIAYLELNYHCGGLCGGGKSIYLKKSDGKWKIIKKWSTWIS